MTMNNNKRNNQERKDKVELANRIANQSKKVAKTYEHIEDAILRVIRWFSSFIDKVIFNQRYGKIVSLIIAIILYLSVSYNSQSSIFGTTLTSSKDIPNVKITANYNAETFEISGLPETANITITGDASSVTTAANQSGYVVANLEGLTEGTHQVRLTTEGFSSNVNIKTDPSTVVITLKKKTTRQFDLGYDFINTDKMDSIYSLGIPEFEYSKVNVRASKDTLDSIAFVKALIDVSGVSSDFDKDVILVAYDKNGQPVTADIIPNTIHVTVPVSSPSKTVPIEIQTTGEVPNNQAIQSIDADQQSVTIYAPDSVLAKIDKVVVSLDVSTITKDSTILRPITLPTGVNSSNINQITMDVKLGDVATKTIDGISINYRNDVNNYKFSPENNITTTSVVVTGTAENIANITADDIYVFFDMSDAKPGVQEFQLQVDQPTGVNVKYSLTQSTYRVTVLGETNSSADPEDGGSGADNG